MYSAKNIKPVNIEEHFRKRPDMYFGPSGPSEGGLIEIIFKTVKCLTSHTPEVERINNLLCIKSNEDWLSVENSYGLTEDNVFDRMWPFPEAGVNSARLEALIKTYSSVLVCSRPGKFTLHKGTLSPNEERAIKCLSNKYARILCFQFNNGS